MTNNWQPFFEQKDVKIETNTEILDRLNTELAKANKGRRTGKLRLSDMLSHWLLEMGKKSPKIEKVQAVPATLDVTLFGLSGDYLEKAASENNISNSEVIEHLLEEYEGKKPTKRRRKRQGATTASKKTKTKVKLESEEKTSVKRPSEIQPDA